MTPDSAPHDSSPYWVAAREAGQRQVDFANRALGVPIDDTTPLEALGERPVMRVNSTRHDGYIRDFDALVAFEIRKGSVSQDVGSTAMTNFRVYMTGNRKPAHTSPRFYS